MLSILNNINEPKDLKNLSIEELEKLASEIREILIKKVSTTGGHFGPNLGMVEATIALHYVFDSPKDNQPVAIRFPNTDVISTGVKVEADFNKLNTYEKTILI